jgi:CBS-domain-containing membrane protein
VSYFAKMKGTTKSPPRVGLGEMLWSWVGAFVGIGAIGYMDFRVLSGTDAMLLIAPFAASAVLVFGAIKSPLAQPRNVLGGHVLSALVGVAFFKVLYQEPWLASALAAATVIVLMHATKTLHPPAGATALTAILGGDKIHSLGFSYALVPVAAGAAILLVVALLVNNIPSSRRYPEFWF